MQLPGILRPQGRLGRAVLAGVAIITATVIAALCVGSDVYARYLTNSLTLYAAERGVRLSVDEPKLRVVGISTPRLEAFVFRPPLLLTLQDAAGAVPVLKLLTFDPSLGVTAKAYGGTVQTACDPGSGGSFRCDFALEGLRPSEHAQLAGLGFSGGTISARSDGLSFDPAHPFPSGTLHIELAKLEKRDDTLTPLFGTRMPVLIPKFSGLNAQSELRFDSDKIRIESLKADFSHGSIDGGGTVSSEAGGGFELALNFDVILSDHGRKTLGPLLGMVSNGKLAQDTRAFKLTVTGNSRKPQVAFVKK